jgi:acyl-CoA thioesterase
MAEVATNPFFEETAVVRLGAGTYAAEIAEGWNLRPLPQGGIVTVLALRAMTEELAHPAQVVRTLHTTFVAQVADGPVRIEVETLREGRSMSHLRAEVKNPGSSHGHVTTAVFGATRDGFSFCDLDPPPAVPPPQLCPSFRDPPPPGADEFEQMPFWATRVEGRAALGHAPWDEYVPGRAETANWYRFDEPPLRDNGTLDPFALVVLVDTMPGAVGEKVGRQGRRWFAPSVDLTVHLFDECRSPWVLAHNRARHAGEGYASVEMSLWDCGTDGSEVPRLVTYGTQLCVFSFAG